MSLQIRTVGKDIKEKEFTPALQGVYVGEAAVFCIWALKETLVYFTKGDKKQGERRKQKS